MTYFPTVIFTVIFLSSNLAYGEGSDFDIAFENVLKQGNADSLNYWASAQNDCEIDPEKLTKTVEGILIRSRLKPVQSAFGKLYLNVAVECIEQGETGMKAFSIETHFAVFEEKPAILYEPDFGGVGYGYDTRHLLDAVRQSVEDAVTKYISVHLDV